MSHQLGQDSQQPERGRHSLRGIMDLRNLCQRLDVDSLKAKLPALPQLKLPKSLPKLRGARRIFRTSRENVNAKSGAAQSATGGAGAAGGPAAGGVGGALGAGGMVGLGVAGLPHAQFINRTPQRISTISSLMQEPSAMTSQHLQPSGATYCSAGSLDDDYYAPYGGNSSNNLESARVSRPISPIKIPAGGYQEQEAGQQVPSGGSLSQRLQRGYKSLSELRLKHLFAKQTTVRKDAIEVQHYVAQYEADRRVEHALQARRDRQIADNYDIHISTLPPTRQNTQRQRGNGEEEEEEEQGIVEHVRRRQAEHSGDESGLETPPTPAPAAAKLPTAVGGKKTGIAATRFAKVRQPPLQMPMEQGHEQEQQQEQEQPQGKQPMRQAMRQNLKRLRKSMKRVQRQPKQSGDETDEDEETQETRAGQSRARGGRGSTLRARLRKFAGSEQLQQRWRKSFKGNEAAESTAEGKAKAGVAAAGGSASGVPTSGLGAAGLGIAGLGTAAAGVGAQLERTMAKLNEKLQNLKFFQAKTSTGAQQMVNKPNTVGREPNEIDDEELGGTYHHSDSSDDSASDPFVDDEEEEQPQQQEERERERVQTPTQPQRVDASNLVKHQTMARLAQLQANSSTAWSSESLEEDGPVEQQLACTASDYPRVLIHQQHTDAYESTLIIAVATTPSPSPSPPAAEKRATPAAPHWVPNEQIIAGFKEQQQQQLGSGAWPGPALYKPKSIDIFESDGGAAAAFADFEEALRNAPVLRISADSSCESNEDADDSSSRVTRIRLQTPRIGNSCESLMEQQPLDEDDDGVAIDEEPDQELEVEQLPPESERPPSESPPPPPLPQRRPPPPVSVAPIYDAVPPPLPISKPPAPPLAAPPSPAAAPTVTPRSPTVPAMTLSRLPQRSASMTRPGKPLVKTSSLRLTYNEQMHPADFGKVNKLISRFEGRPRLCARRLHSEELTICSDEESEQLSPTPTPTPTSASHAKRNNNNTIPDIITTAAVSPDPLEKSVQLSLDRQNSNCSRSEYGSPLSYSRNATPTTAGAALQPQIQPQSQRSQARRSRRSMTRDDDNFYSFDSDEENSYYSISPSSSSRYVVEI